MVFFANFLLANYLLGYEPLGVALGEGLGFAASGSDFRLVMMPESNTSPVRVTVLKVS